MASDARRSSGALSGSQSGAATGKVRDATSRVKDVAVASKPEEREDGEL